MHDDTKERTGIDRAPLAIGLALMVAGAVLALARLDVLELSRVGPWWPLVMVAAGLVGAAAGEGPKAWRTGLWVALIGGWLLVNTLELGDFRWWNSWPLVVMLAGAFQLLWPDDGEERSGGVFTLAIGAWLLVSTHGWFGLDWSDSWPIVLVIAGLGMVVKAAAQARGRARRQA